MNTKQFDAMVKLARPNFITEPFFILRGSDMAALHAIRQYEQQATDLQAKPEYLEKIKQVRREFNLFWVDNVFSMKVPGNE